MTIFFLPNFSWNKNMLQKINKKETKTKQKNAISTIIYMKKKMSASCRYVFMSGVFVENVF